MKFSKVTNIQFFLMFLILSFCSDFFPRSENIPESFGRLVTKKTQDSNLESNKIINLKNDNQNVAKKFVEKIDPVSELILKIDQCTSFQDNNDLFSHFRLIHNQAKSIASLDELELEKILFSLNKLFKNFFAQPEALASKNSSAEKIESLILDMFISSADEFKTNPSKVITDVSKKTAQSSFLNVQEEINILEKIRQTLIRFVELQTDKLEWSGDFEKLIDSFLEIANQIFLLAKNDVIDDNDVFCDLIKSLIARLDLFLKQNQNRLNLSFFESFKTVLDLNEADFFLEIKEADEVSQDNKAYLLETLGKHYEIFVQRQDEKAANVVAA